MKKTVMAAAAAAALAATCYGVRVHRSFSNGVPVTPSTSPNARNYGTTGAGMITRRNATPPFDFFTGGRFALGGVHVNDKRREVVSAAPKAGAASIKERVLEEKDGKPYMKEMIILPPPQKGILVGRTGAQGGPQTEYRVGQLSVLLRNDTVQQVQASFISDAETLAKFRDWAKPVFDRKCGVNAANTDVIPRGGFNAEPDLPRTNSWKSAGFVYELRYEPTPSRLIISVHR